jgi:uncharacterized membrane protein YfcA
LFTSILLLITAGFGAGVMNALAGGGSFLTFPALVFMGVPSIAANASSTVALFPAAFASAWGYRSQISGFPGISLTGLFTASLAGGAAGALLLLYTPQETFDAIVPWLLLGATLTFIFAPRMTSRGGRLFRVRPFPFLTMHFCIGVYAGYFGGALGLITLAAWNLYGFTDIKALNPTKILLGGATNAAAVICFLLIAEIWWRETAFALAGAVIGGYAGARAGLRISPEVTRWIVTAISVFMTVVFFLR